MTPAHAQIRTQSGPLEVWGELDCWMTPAHAQIRMQPGRFDMVETLAVLLRMMLLWLAMVLVRVLVLVLVSLQCPLQQLQCWHPWLLHRWHPWLLHRWHLAAAPLQPQPRKAPVRAVAFKWTSCNAQDDCVNLSLVAKKQYEQPSNNNDICNDFNLRVTTTFIIAVATIGHLFFCNKAMNQMFVCSGSSGGKRGW